MTADNGARPPAEAPARNTGKRPTRMTARARAHRARWLRHAGLRVNELDAVANAYLYQWAEALAAQEFGAARLAMQSLERRMPDIAARAGAASGDFDLDALNRSDRAIVDRAERILRDLERASS